MGYIFNAERYCSGSRLMFRYSRGARLPTLLPLRHNDLIGGIIRRESIAVGK